METFLIALTAVGTMLLYAVPGFLSVRIKAVKPDSIKAFAFILMYVCNPCLVFHTLIRAEYTKSLAVQMVAVFGVSLAVMGVMLAAMFLIFRRKFSDVRYRVYTVAGAFGNCAFMGVPLLEALFPDEPNALVFSIAFLVAMNLIGWTVGSAIIARDKKYVSLKKALLNPVTIGVVLALPFCFTGAKLPAFLMTPVELLGKMTTPMCMLVMGMRLATVRFRDLALSPMQYLIVAVKQLVFPFLGLLAVWFLPLDEYVRIAMFVLSATPVASVVLNYAELIGEGQDTAANVVLLGTVFSIVTIPLMTLIVYAL